LRAAFFLIIFSIFCLIFPAALGNILAVAHFNPVTSHKSGIIVPGAGCSGGLASSGVDKQLHWGHLHPAADNAE